jgi:glycosyltransferase involved in cell wall biosynthesis
VIAGDGPERSGLEARARARASHVEFLGMVDAARRDRLLREASVVVVPSRTLSSGRTEGMPMIALEALAAGVPVVASSVGGLPELATAARLVRPERPAELARAIDQTLAEPSAAGAPGAVAELQRAVAHLDWRNVAHRLVRNP